jgi:hypothetical protein
MKKIILILLTLVSIATFSYRSVYAVEILEPVCGTNSAANPDICNDEITDDTNPIVGPEGIITKAVGILSIIIGVVAVIVLIWSGLRFILSQGDSGKISTARSQIIYAVVGIVVAGLAQAIVQLVLKRVNV